MAVKKMSSDVMVRLTKVTIIEDHYLIKARFDYSIKAGEFVQTVRGSALTQRKGAFSTDYGVMPYSSVRENKDGSKDYFPKAKVNPALELKLVQEVTTALKYAESQGLAELKINDLLESIYKEDKK